MTKKVKVSSRFSRFTVGLFVGFLYEYCGTSHVPSELEFANPEDSDGWKWNQQKFAYYFAQTIFRLYDSSEKHCGDLNKENYNSLLRQTKSNTLKGEKQSHPAWSQAFRSTGSRPDKSIFTYSGTVSGLSINPFESFIREYKKHPAKCYSGMHTFLNEALKPGSLEEVFYGLRYMILHDKGFDTSQKFIINNNLDTITISELQMAPLNLTIDMDYFMTDIFMKTIDHSSENIDQNIKWKEFKKNFYTTYYTAEPQADSSSHRLIIRYDKILYADKFVMDLLNSLDTRLHTCNEFYAWSELDVRDKIADKDIKQCHLKDTRSCYNKIYFPWIISKEGYHREGFSIEYNYDTGKDFPRIIFGAYCFEETYYNLIKGTPMCRDFESAIKTEFEKYGCINYGTDGSWYLPDNITPKAPLEKGPLWIRKPNWRVAFVWELKNEDNKYIELIRNIVTQILEPRGSEYFESPI